MELIYKSWGGQEKLWKVFWIYGVLFALPFVAAFLIAGKIGTFLLVLVGLIYLIYLVWVYVSMWKCSFNCGWRGWGYIVRVLVVLNVLSMVLGPVMQFV